MDGYRVNAADEGAEKPWWDKNWVWLLAGVPYAIALIVADHYGYGGLLEWAFAFAAGTSVAVAAFWERRSAPWFVPAVAFLIIAHILVLASRHWNLIPSRHTGTYMALKGVGGMDFAVSGLFLWCMHRLFDPRTGLKAHWSTTAKLVTSVFALIAIGILGFAVLVIVHAHNEKVATSQLVFSHETTEEMDQVLSCIDGNAVDNDQWKDLHDRYRGKQLFNEFWGRTIRVFDIGKARLVQVETPHGRPLRDEEKQLFQKCLA